MQYIKSYHLFLSRRWLRISIYFIYPALYLEGYLFLCNQILSMPPASEEDLEHLFSLLIWALGNLLVTLEFFADSLIFGGISAKDTNKLEYLKTSPRGIACLQKALLTDGIRRFLSLLLIVGVCCLLSNQFYSPLDALALTFTFFTFIELGFLITRRFTGIAVSLITVSVIYTLLPASTVLIKHAPLALKLLIPLFMGVSAAVIERWIILQKARNSYYDNRNDENA